MAFDYKTYLDELFENAETVIEELSINNQPFTSYAFIRRITQTNQGTYIRYLCAALKEYGDERPFNIVHGPIGKRLSEVAQELGYTQDKHSSKPEMDIFGTEKGANVVTYTREDKLK